MNSTQGTLARVTIGLMAGLLSVTCHAEVSTEKAKAQSLAVGCLSCHGETGEGRGSLPPLSPLDRDTFIRRFQAFRSESKTSSVMHRIARGYSDEEIKRMAALLAKGSPR